MKDSGLFTLPCRLGDSKPFDNLADLESCVNLIPLYLFKKLKIGLLKETNHVFRLACRIKFYPIDIVKNVEVHFGKLKFLEDFYVIDIEKDPATPLLIGKGFLVTASVVIDYKKAKIAVGEGVTRLIFGVKEINLGTIPINLKESMWELEELIEKRIYWNRPPKEGDGAWHIKIELIDPDKRNLIEPFNQFPQLGDYSRRRIQVKSLTWIIFYDS
nr:hypothetical protein [Tanacetum cinerariifolium]